MVPFPSSLQEGWGCSPGRQACNAGPSVLLELFRACLSRGEAGLCSKDPTSPAPSGRLRSIRGGSATPGQDKATLVWVKQSVQTTFSSGAELPPCEVRGFFPSHRAPHFVAEGPWADLPFRSGLSAAEGGDGEGEGPLPGCT